MSAESSLDAPIQPAVKKGDQGKVIGGVFFAVPEDFGFVGEWVADGGEAAFEELGKAFVLALFGVGFEEVEGENGILDGEDFVHEGGTVAFDAGEIADALGKAFGGFEDGVEVVVLEEFDPAVFGDFVVDGAPAEFLLDGSETGFGLVERGSYLGPAELAILAKFEAGQ